METSCKMELHSLALQLLPANLCYLRGQPLKFRVVFSNRRIVGHVEWVSQSFQLCVQLFKFPVSVFHCDPPFFWNRATGFGANGAAVPLVLTFIFVQLDVVIHAFGNPIRSEERR